MKKLVYLFIILSISYAAVNAQAAISSVEIKNPVLNAHLFPSVNYLRSPFVNTNLQADIGLGNTSYLKMPGITIGDYEIGGREGKIQYADMDIKYQQRFTPWLSMFFSIKMAARVGTNMPTLLVDGVNKLSAGEIGWLVRIVETDKLYLSGSVSLVSVSGEFINVADYFRDIINNEPDPSVYEKVPGMSIGLSSRGAYALSPTIGLQANLEYAYGESLERGATKGYFSGGILGDVDFNPKFKVPLGLAFGYSLSSSPEIVMSDGGSANLFIVKIGYTRARDFDLGLQFTYYSVYLQSLSDNAFVAETTLAFKFYF